jgi:hypothetical protein
MASAYNPRAAKRAQKKVRASRRRLRQSKAASQQAKQYDPLAPLTGPRERQETRAAEKLEFGPRAQELRGAIANQDQTTADRAQYFDDYKQALRESTARVNEANRVNVEQTQARVDQSYQQDSAAVKQRDAAESEQAAKLGRAPVQSQEGARAVEAQRSQGDQSLARLRGQAGADTSVLEKRVANSVLKKIEDQGRMASRRGKLRDEEKNLAAERGAFRVDQRRKNRSSEREWAAIQKEFGLKKRGQDLEFKNTKADRAIERGKLATQKIVARLYSSADKASARAQIRVAQLQLEKGKISKEQFKTITNIYKGLPEKPTDFTFTYKGAGGDKNKGKLQPWEKDKVNDAVYSLGQENANSQNKAKWMSRMQEAGLTRRLAAVAWARYVKSLRGTNYNGPR